ncbi:hypothetical protein [Achromobacter xylosoxidans]|nr:hypothetical protein [Achromobacter xylosoxidans]
MNWMEFGIGFAAGCGYSTAVTFVLAYLDRRDEFRRKGAGR